jgi:hypothetical protein
MADVSGLIPEARPLARKAAAVYLRNTAPWFIGLIVYGSAVKGGVIPGCSDIDFQLYLEDSAFSWAGQLPLELGFAIRRDMADIDLGPFRYVQCYARKGEREDDLVGPIPGAYHLIAGRLPVPEATAGELQESATKALTQLNPAPTYIMGKLLGPGGVRLARSIRLLCTQVWPVLYQVLTLRQKDPIGVWRLPKGQAIERLPEGTALGDSIRRFYAAVQAYYPNEDSLEGAFSIFESGVGFLEVAKSWWDEAARSDSSPPSEVDAETFA